MKDKKGMSGVITVIILVALVLIAIGVIWGVVSNILEGESDSIESSSNCLNLNVRPVGVVCNAGICNTTVRRQAGGDTLGGVMIVYHDGSEYSQVFDQSGNIPELGSETYTNHDTGLTDPNRVEVTPYVIDSKGIQQICQNTNTFNF